MIALALGSWGWLSSIEARNNLELADANAQEAQEKFEDACQAVATAYAGFRALEQEGVVSTLSPYFGRQGLKDINRIIEKCQQNGYSERFAE